MYQKDWTESIKTALTLDKKKRKAYTGLKDLQTHLTAFDDDATADAAVDYLYAKDNQSKTQGFLQNYGFPSAQDRDLNKQLYGVPEEKQQLRDMLKSKTSSILNPKLPTETDRAFLHGLMGEKDGEDDYQKHFTDANRAVSDLQNAFQGSQFEREVKPIISTIASSDETQIPKIHTLNAFDLSDALDVVQASGNSIQSSGFQPKKQGNQNYWYIDGSDNPTPPNIPSPFDKPLKSDKPEAPNNTTPGGNSNTTNNSMPESKSSTTYGPMPNASENTKKPQEPKPKAVRTNVENAGGTVIWNPENNKATIKINGYTEDLYVGDGNGTFIQDGVMYTDDMHLDNLIYAPKQTQVKTIYDGITDDFGKFVVRKWLYGDGSEVHVSGEKWNEFIKTNSKVQEKFEKTVQEAIRAGETSFNIEKESVALSENGQGGYGSGYELINGSNGTVGGFTLQGTLSPKSNGRYLVTINYTFNDIIDANPLYRTDREYSAAAKALGVYGKDYTLRISGTVTFIYSNHGGLLYYVQ